MVEKMPNLLEEARRHFLPPLPRIFQDLNSLGPIAKESGEVKEAIQTLFPKTGNQPIVHFEQTISRNLGSLGPSEAIHANNFQNPYLTKNPDALQGRVLQQHQMKKPSPKRVGVVLSGGQAAGGHNVIVGLFDALVKLHPSSKLFGFLKGPSGILENHSNEMSSAYLSNFRNTGGFDMIGSGRTKIETKEQLEAALQSCRALNLDGLVIVGGDDSNTNAAILAEYFLTQGCKTCVVGVPKTIDGDLKNSYVATSFGFDTACKIYAEMIGNICRDALSAKKYTHFIKLMGRSASHIALECTLQTHPNMTLIGEEVAAKKMTLKEIVDALCDCIVERGVRGKNYGVILIPEGLIEFVPEMKVLIQELNTLLSRDPTHVTDRLSKEAAATFSYLPREIQEQLMLERDPHGNIQVSQIATDQLLINAVKKNLKTRGDFTGKFSPVGHFFGYEGRCGYPSNFDATYCYALGFTSAILIENGLTGYMSALQKLAEPPEEWMPAGFPLTVMMDVEERSGKRGPVIKKALVNLEGEPFKFFASHRQEWMLNDHYRFPGPIQFFGPQELCNETTFTLKLEQHVKAHTK